MAIVDLLLQTYSCKVVVELLLILSLCLRIKLLLVWDSLLSLFISFFDARLKPVRVISSWFDVLKWNRYIYFSHLLCHSTLAWCLARFHRSWGMDTAVSFPWLAFPKHLVREDQILHGKRLRKLKHASRKSSLSCLALHWYKTRCIDRSCRQFSWQPRGPYEESLKLLT